MNKITTLFQEKPRNVLSVYYTAGYPRPDDTIPVLQALLRAGVDMIEIGVPFSDPVADGPVIQQSNTRALRGGMTLQRLLQELRPVAPNAAAPVLLMSYLNPILQYGFASFCRDATAAGVSGVIIPDLPPRECAREYKPVADQHDLKMIMLVTPQTSHARVRAIDRLSGGFIYAVSTAAVTGAREHFDSHTIDYLQRLQEMKTRNPLLVGFGISNKATFDAACAHAAGAIIGSKFVSLLDSSATPDEAVAELVRTIRP